MPKSRSTRMLSYKGGAGCRSRPRSAPKSAAPFAKACLLVTWSAPSTTLAWPLTQVGVLSQWVPLRASLAEEIRRPVGPMKLTLNTLEDGIDKVEAILVGLGGASRQLTDGAVAARLGDVG